MPHLSKPFTRFVLNILGKSGLADAIKPLFGGMGAILMFHHVGHRAPRYFGGNDHLSIRPEFLHALLDEFRRECIDIVSIDEALKRIAKGNTKQPFVALTFDDGYRDNIETAYPILQAFKVPFTLFVCSGFVDRKICIWWLSLEQIIQANNSLDLLIDGEQYHFFCPTKNEKRQAFARAARLLSSVNDDVLQGAMSRLYKDTGHNALALVDEEMSTWHMLKKLNQDPLVTIGAHTVNHPFLPHLNEEKALDEMVKSAIRIEEMIGVKPKYFAYPYGFKGAVGKREVDLAKKAGFEAAFTTRKGILLPEHEDHLWSLPRVSVNGHYQNIPVTRALLSGFPFYLANGFNRLKTL